MTTSPKACLVCFSMNVKLFSLYHGSLREDLQLLTDIHFKEGLLEYLCFECMANVRRFTKFKDKCRRAVDYLMQLLSNTKEISMTHLLLVDRNNLGIMPSLSYLDTTKADYKEITCQSDIQNPEFTKKNCIPKVHYSVNYNQNEVNVSEWDVKVTNTYTPVKMEEEMKVNISNNKMEIDSDDFVYECDEFQHEDDETLKNVIDDNINKTTIKTEEEYANLYPISLKEAKAAAKVSLLCQKVGNFNCAICKKSFKNLKTLDAHLRMHDIHISGTFHCKICHYYYKTDLLLQLHMREKHMYKYVCKRCPDVNFDRRIAKQHFILSHLNKKDTLGTDWSEIRPTWLKKKTFTEAKPSKNKTKSEKKSVEKPVKKPIKKPLADDYFDRTPIIHEEQYKMVQDRMTTINYLGSEFKCDLCYRGFKETRTYDRHMQKHDPAISGKYECDMCKLRFKNTRKVYAHIRRTHLYKYTCRFCAFVCYNNCQVNVHYRWHKNVTYPCSFCGKVYKKQSSLLTHIRIYHPSMCMCKICGHSFVTENGLNCHMQYSHTKQEIELCDSMQVDKSSQLYCSDCDVQFLNQSAFTTHLGSSNKHVSTNISTRSERNSKDTWRRKRGHPDIINDGKPVPTNCEVCGKYLANDLQARKHYETEHPGKEYLKRYMCDICGHTTKNYQNLMHHIRSHTQEKPYSCPHCDKTFSQPGNMKRHLDVHTGEKRFLCEHCNRRFAQKITMKLHIQTVHFKIPYPLWDKKNRKRRNEAKQALESISTAEVLASISTASQKGPNYDNI
ncbi:hypothetical protein K1T71_013590 [Dendrolimus kikuchii]|uniref:Uncharacterized protein n=1 Tax=Dendrolimus kikuchii TaxID=765133 RepID=A0ACC1CH26_9NEOP|nr:hypothetical protein K1T71_013590 [Dendrolimus kikuchii]